MGIKKQKHPLFESYVKMFKETPSGKKVLHESDGEIFNDPEYKTRCKEIARILDGYVRSGEPHLILDGSRGTYIPQKFVEHFFNNITLNPDDETYWEDFDQILNDINSEMHNGYLMQDDDLVAYPNDYDPDTYES